MSNYIIFDLWMKHWFHFSYFLFLFLHVTSIYKTSLKYIFYIRFSRSFHDLCYWTIEQLNMLFRKLCIYLNHISRPNYGLLHWTIESLNIAFRTCVHIRPYLPWGNLWSTLNCWPNPPSPSLFHSMRPFTNTLAYALAQTPPPPPYWTIEPIEDFKSLAIPPEIVRAVIVRLWYDLINAVRPCSFTVLISWALIARSMYGRRAIDLKSYSPPYSDRTATVRQPYDGHRGAAG